MQCKIVKSQVSRYNRCKFCLSDIARSDNESQTTATSYRDA